MPKLKEFIAPKLEEINETIKKSEMRTDDKFKQLDSIIG